MSKEGKYTLETLLPLNVSYDYDHMLTQGDVDMVNSLIEVIGKFDVFGPPEAVSADPLNIN